MPDGSSDALDDGSIRLLAIAEAAAEVLVLQRQAYRIEADLIGFDRIPPLVESEATLRRSGEAFLGLRGDDGSLRGALAYRLVGETLDIHRLMVDPGHFRQGVARRLMRDVLARGVAAGATRAVVQTGTGNAPALALYAGCGFTVVGERTVGGRLRLALLERAL